MIEKKKLLMIQLMMTMLIILILLSLSILHIFDIFRGLQFILACLTGVIGFCSILLSLYKLMSNSKEHIKVYRR